MEQGDTRAGVRAAGDEEGGSEYGFGTISLFQVSVSAALRVLKAACN